MKIPGVMITVWLMLIAFTIGIAIVASADHQISYNDSTLFKRLSTRGHLNGKRMTPKQVEFAMDLPRMIIIDTDSMKVINDFWLRTDKKFDMAIMFHGCTPQQRLF